MTEPIELTRTELLRELMRAQDERDVAVDELQRLKRAELKLAMELSDYKRSANQYFWIAFGGLLFGLAVLIIGIVRSM